MNERKRKYKILKFLRCLIEKNNNNFKKNEIDIQQDKNHIIDVLIGVLEKYQNAGCYEISLNDEKIKQDTIKINQVLDEYKVDIPHFKTPTKELSYITLKELIIKIIYESDYGYYDSENEILYFYINDYNNDGIEESEKIKKIINKIYQNLTKNKTKKLVPGTKNQFYK